MSIEQPSPPGMSLLHKRATLRIMIGSKLARNRKQVRSAPNIHRCDNDCFAGGQTRRSSSPAGNRIAETAISLRRLARSHSFVGTGPTVTIGRWVTGVGFQAVLRGNRPRAIIFRERKEGLFRPIDPNCTH